MSIYQENEVSFQPTYLYIKQHTITGKLYFGKTSNNPEKYYGSGKHWIPHIKKHGIRYVVNLWYELFTDINEIQKFALSFSKEMNIVESKQWLNLKFENGLDGGSLGISQEIRDNWSKIRKGRKVTDEAKRKQSESTKGIPKSSKTRELMRIATLGRKQKLVICPHCKRVGGINNMMRYHFDNCKHYPLNSKKDESIECPHCNKRCSPGNAKRWHFDNCKFKP